MFSGCARVKIKNVEFCGDKGSRGATCFHTLSNDKRDIPKEAWDNYRFGMICSKADTFAEWKKAIIKLCKLSKRCSYDTKKKINEFGDNIEDFQLDIDTLEQPEH